MTETDGRVVSFIDMGTNSVRLMIAGIHPDRQCTVISRQKEMIRLGEGVFDHGFIHPQTIKKAVEVCRNFVDMSRSFNASEIVAVATSAAREAGNRRELLARLKDDAGLELKIISGSEEARLIYLGMVKGMNLKGKAFFIDIGGGSTELIVGDESRHCYLDSLKLGGMRLNTLHFTNQQGPIDPVQYMSAQEHIRNSAVLAMGRIRKYSLDKAFGCSGTIQSLAEIASHAFHKADEARMWRLSLEDIRKVSALLCSMGLEKRKSLPGMIPRRADIIISGAAILETILTDLDIDEIHVSRHELRDGLLLDYLNRRHHPLMDELSVRQKSVLALGRRCDFDEVHAKTVARLALELFDSAREIKLHEQDSLERELLFYASLLHDIGTFLSYTRHHANSCYFIRNSDLLGFNQEEIIIMAAVAMFHRKAIPDNDNPEFASLDQGAKDTVMVLSIMLRIAESLDRSHASLVESAGFLHDDNNDVILKILSSKHCKLELWGVRKHRDAFEKVFGKKLAILYASKVQ